MVAFNRREFVMSAAAAGAVFGVTRPVEFIPSAMAQAAASPLNPSGAKFHKFKVGDADVTTIFDGAITRDIDPGFIRNASVDEIKAALRAANYPDDKLPNTYTITVVQIGGKTVMFDSGNGGGGPAGTGQTFENMKAAGIDPAKLDAIVVTHFHPDHINGLYGKDNAAMFAQTEIVVPEAEYKFWADPAVIEKLPEARRGIPRRVQSTMTGWKNLRPVAANTDVLPGIRAVPTYGHTPGHTSYIVGNGATRLFVLGDVNGVPAINMANPGWHVVFDQDPQMAEATRRATFDRAIADKMVCTGYHWGMPGAGTLTKSGNGYALVPVA